jgi:hypothetical protein
LDDSAIIGFNPVNFVTVSLMIVLMWALVGGIKHVVSKAKSG